MPKGISKLILTSIVASVLWFVGFSVIAVKEWHHRAAERAYLYEQCLEQSPDVAECQALRAATGREDFDDVATDFSIAGLAPIAALWLTIWLMSRRKRQRDRSAS